MSFLIVTMKQDKEPQDFTKAVVSFWFRIPQQSVDNAIKAGKVYPEDALTKPYQYKIPLVSFGPQTETQEVTDQLTQIGSIAITGIYETGETDPDTGFPILGYKDLGILPVVVFAPYAGPKLPFESSWIGVECDPDTGKMNISMMLYTSTHANVTGAYFTETSFVGTPLSDGSPSRGFISIPPIPSEVYLNSWALGFGTTTFEDTSWRLTVNVENYGGTGNIKVTPNTWHHLLISWDISGAVETSTVNVKCDSKMWLALDDVNYDGDDLPAWRVEDSPPNDIIPRTASEVTDIPVDSSSGAIVTYKLEKPKLLVSPVCLPSNNFKNLQLTLPYEVELAELLMFSGVTLDTSIEENRRLFITAPGKDGKQYPINSTPIYIPMTKTAVGDPTTWEPGVDSSAYTPPPSALDPSAMPTGIRALGGVAAVDFTKAQTNWQMGRNLGTAGGKAVKTGKIKAYSPDPSIESNSSGGG